MATLTISLKKITSEVKFTERKSALLQNNNKNSAFCSVLQGNPAVASPEEHLYEQMTSITAFTERNIQKKKRLSHGFSSGEKIFGHVSHSSKLVRMYVFVLSTPLTPTAPIGSPIICM